MPSLINVVKLLLAAVTTAAVDYETAYVLIWYQILYTTQTWSQYRFN